MNESGARVGKPNTAEMHPGPGFRVRAQIERPTAAEIETLSRFETPAVSDLMNRLYTMASEIRLLTDPGHRIAGPACTVRVYPGDNLMVHKSLDVAEPGDVIVVDAASSELTAVLGDLVCTKARHRRISGVIVDGLVRDLPAIRALGDFPVFARGVTPVGPLHRGPGEINYPVSSGGVVVHPGDVVIGDLNGVVVVPREAAGVLGRRLEARHEAEAEYVASVAKGEFSNAWVDALLADAGVHADAGDGD